jgi:hypothetical protein
MTIPDVCVACSRPLAGAELQYTPTGEPICAACAPQLDDAELDARGPQRLKAAIASFALGALGGALLGSWLFVVPLSVLAISSGFYAMLSLPERASLGTLTRVLSILGIIGGFGTLLAFVLALLSP